MGMIRGVDATRFSAARDQAHWASQILSAACDAAIDKRSDDSQSSLALDDRTGSWVTEAFPSGGRLGIDLGAGRLSTISEDDQDATLDLEGRTLEAALGWVAGALPDLTGKEVRVRDYDLPEHPFGAGAAFDASDGKALRAVADAMGNAFRRLDGYHCPDPRAETPLLLWPHHFDVGKILLLREGADPAKDPCVGIGFSAGDASVSQPYYYANPYAIEKPVPLPELPHGEWASGWFGAVQRTSEAAPPAGAVESMFSTVADLVLTAINRSD